MLINNMKILLVDNNTQHLNSLTKALSGHSVEIQKYHPALNFHHQRKDMVILSGGGGEGLEIHDTYKAGELWYDHEMEFTRDCPLPVIGICMGFEVIARLFGSDIQQTSSLVQGFTTLNTTSRGRTRLGKKEIKQFESHNWRVPSVDNRQFEVLASSSTGVEMIKHKERPIIATQFHPEIDGGTLKLSQIIPLLQP